MHWLMGGGVILDAYLLISAGSDPSLYPGCRSLKFWIEYKDTISFTCCS